MSHEFPVAKVAATADALIVRDVTLSDAQGLSSGGRPVPLVVGAATYSATKCIKFKVGNDTYLLPLFGPVAS